MLNNGLVCPIVGISTDDEDTLIESIKQGVRLIDTSLSSLVAVRRALSHG